MYETSVTEVEDSGWFQINLSSPYNLDITRDIWISIRIYLHTSSYGLSVGCGPAVPYKGDFIFSEDLGWLELRNLQNSSGGYMDFNWNIEAIVQGEGFSRTLEITDISGIIGANAVIKNIGNFETNDINWSIMIRGGILNSISIDSSGIISRLSPNETRRISTIPFLGFGRIFISIMVESNHTETVSKDAWGFSIGMASF